MSDPISPNSCPEFPAERLESFRSYLLMVANRETSPQLRVYVAPSDLVQQTLILANRDINQFRGTTEKELLGWLTTILLRQIASAARRPQFPPSPQPISSVDGEDHNTPSSHLIAEEESRRLHEAINSLEAEHREVIELRNFQGLTLEEIGERTGMCGSGVKKRWNIAIRELKRRLKEKR